MRLTVLLSLLCLAGCSAGPSLPEQGFIGESGWRHQQAVQDAEVIMQGMNRARADSERYAKQP